jgi:hypothetical protein
MDAAMTLSPQRLEKAAEASKTPNVVQQHIGWLKFYIERMTPENWRDMQSRASRQLAALSAELTERDAG